MSRIYLNEDWLFTEQFSEPLLQADGSNEGLIPVRIPHTVKETPFNCFDESIYQMVSGYKRILTVPKEWEGKNLLLTFDGIAHISEVYVNGKLVGEHKCGYTGFTMNIAEFVNYGADNTIVVKADSREQVNVPPFGFVIDYMTYGGMYRDVYLEVKEASYLEDVFAYPQMADFSTDGFTGNGALCSNVTICGTGDFTVKQFLMRADGTDESMILEEKTTGDKVLETKCTAKNVLLWSTEHPELYLLRTELWAGDSKLDESLVRFGFRSAEFRKDGFYLNGKKFKIRGLNRHQCYAYVGYAMPKSMQVMDADVCKKELGLNAVRTSHYPQSHYFLDRCDEIGLLVFTEMPGWQHIGDEEWKLQAIENTKDMVKQYRNHTSIMLWGVRINESVDDDDFYTRTNKAAHELDPSRQTGGVRCYKKSNLLEDVYTYNDFIHDGVRHGCDPKKAVTSDMNKGYMISEYNGHMYPTKNYDDEEHRAEHALRHANVLDAVASNDDIAGSFGWCMFDYNTHKDFGGGDRICYHGVMDMYRNAKMAAAIYACQQDKEPVLLLSSAMDIGEHPGCNRGYTYIITNADSVRMYKNDRFIKEYKAGDTKYKHLSHGPILLDDYIGDVLEKEEHMSPKKTALVKEVLNEAAALGMYRLQTKTKLKAARLMAFHHMKVSEAVELYNKYVGDWGGESTVYRFEAIKDGKVVKTLFKQPMREIHLEVSVDHTALKEEQSYDVAAVRIQAVDEYGNVMPYFQEPVVLQAEGGIEVIGPDIISLKGGMGGTYVKTTGVSGDAKLVLKNVQTGTKEITFTIEA